MNAPLAPAAPNVRVLTFGCRLNTLESEVMRRAAEEAGLRETILVNSCAVTGEAMRQARQAIRKARRESPHARIVVTGCGAQTSPESFAAMAEVDRVLGNAEKLDAAVYVRLAHEDAPRVLAGDIMSVRENAGHLVDAVAGRTRAFVEVQTGCDHRCTFCIIPFGRGPSRSVPAGRVVEAVRALVSNGAKEVVLTGVDLTSYGADLPGRPTLGRLVKRILDGVPELARLRLSSLDAVEIDDTLLALLGEEPRLMPHLHLSLQAGDDLILKRMKRRHTRAQAIALCDSVRALRPEIALGADLIAGFPTETEDMFAGTLSLVEECGLAFVHAFPFSPREGTPAARMPQLDRALVKERAARLREAGEAARAHAFAARVGSRASILVEEPGVGHTDYFMPVRIDAGAPGEIVAARIVDTDGAGLVGVAA
ncbi:MAG: tRNA (N(6)-L-threonylcarbamoyladenosine(37)-C(2))-methylthiotransferase MtaB [Alphaproteobacteria bacterium]|nr:tRNA (N(6)-L-threonylcarbamoyladenosine(37)-C(2))-methylthiotransferase MtaB [Alphaproteobacteria bacterium]